MLCNDIHSALEAVLSRYDRSQTVVVADANVPFDTALPVLRLPVSERDKSLETVERIWDFLFERRITRSGLLVAVGGGVLTDMAGFAAATYKRGIDYVNVPTTLLAMVDASYGGKTGINRNGLKNSIGLFAPPVETLVSMSWLATLPAGQLLSGYAEMLKTALVAPAGRFPGLWHRVLQYDLDTMPDEALAPLVGDCIAVKRHIVETDPRERNLRKALNFGHTFGHALEEASMTDAASLLHGYAVLYGMTAALYLSVTRIGCPREPLQQLTRLMLSHYGRPQCKCSNRERLVHLMLQDKKNGRPDRISCTLLHGIGEPVIDCYVSEEDALEALDYLFSL